MAIFKVTKFPDPVLLRKIEPLEAITERERILVRDMIDTMHAEKGVGLAANQIGVARRIFIASPDQKRGNELVFVNPQIIRRSGRICDQEGCLSIPGYYEDVVRASRVTLRAMTIEMQPVEVEAEGLLARIFQHETDHLDGLVYVHRLGFFKKRKAFKSLGIAGAAGQSSTV